MSGTMRAEGLLAAPIAHRGLHTDDVPENSLLSFSRAAERRLGVELDVRLSADGVPVVHHDASLQRMCGVPDVVAHLPAATLTRLSLNRTHERLPTLAAALHVIDGQVPLLVDAKTGWSRSARRRLVDALAILLRSYRGPVAVVGFDPFTLSGLADRAPRLLRGQSAGVDPSLIASRWWYRVACHPSDALWSMRLSNPHFVCFNVDRMPSSTVARVRAARPVVAWTVRTRAAYERARAHADGIIVEGQAVDLVPVDATGTHRG